MEARKAEERESSGGPGRRWSVAEQGLREEGKGTGEGAAEAKMSPGLLAAVTVIVGRSLWKQRQTWQRFSLRN